MSGQDCGADIREGLALGHKLFVQPLEDAVLFCAWDDDHRVSLGSDPHCLTLVGADHLSGVLPEKTNELFFLLVLRGNLKSAVGAHSANFELGRQVSLCSHPGVAVDNVHREHVVCSLSRRLRDWVRRFDLFEGVATVHYHSPLSTLFGVEPADRGKAYVCGTPRLSYLVRLT